MRVSGLDENGDWRFGRGKAVYISRSAAVRQNVVTRLKSFKTDFFLDVDACIDWIDLLGRKGTKTEIMLAVERVTLATDGVTTISNLSIEVKTGSRDATIMLTFGTIFDEDITEEITI